MAKKKAAEKPAAAEPRRTVATYHLRITLHERADHAATEWGQSGEPAPDGPGVDELIRITGQALYDALPYFSMREIGIAGERTDR